MILKKLACTLTLLAVAAPAAFGQLPQPAKKPTDDPAALRKDAVAFLRETMADVSNLRTLENRISFSAELAGLMWFHDEKEARSLYLIAFGNFKELLMQYDMEMNAFGPPEEGEAEAHSYRGGGMFGEVTEKSRLMRRFQTAMQVRQQIAMSLAEHDAELAFGFYYESLAALSNPIFRKQMEARDTYFEGQLLTQIAQSDAAKAAQLGAKAIQDGVNHQHIELLKKIHQKDPAKGAEFAASLLGKLKTDKEGSTDFWIMSALLNTVSESLENSKREGGGPKPMLDQQGVRDLADTFAQLILNNEEEYANGLQYVDQIEKYAPSRGVQIRTKFKSLSLGSAAANTASHAANVSNLGTASSNSNTAAQREKTKQELAEKAASEFKDSVDKLGKKQLSKEEREKIITQARRILLQSPGKDKKIAGLSALAAQLAKAGDKDLAAEIMKEAQALVNPLPKTYQDFLLTWMLASGYAESDPEKAYPLLEDTILRANDTITAFIKVGEFIDVAGEMIDEGEVQVGAFGGQMVRGLTSELGMADATLRTLAKADFKKTRDLTSRFDRSEVRILAKMMILRAVLNEDKQKDKQKKEDEEVESASLK